MQPCPWAPPAAAATSVPGPGGVTVTRGTQREGAGLRGELATGRGRKATSGGRAHSRGRCAGLGEDSGPSVCAGCSAWPGRAGRRRRLGMGSGDSVSAEEWTGQRPAGTATLAAGLSGRAGHPVRLNFSTLVLAKTPEPESFPVCFQTSSVPVACMDLTPTERVHDWLCLGCGCVGARAADGAQCVRAGHKAEAVSDPKPAPGKGTIAQPAEVQTST